MLLRRYHQGEEPGPEPDAPPNDDEHQEQEADSAPPPTRATGRSAARKVKEE
ncbi:hypothetical protein ACQEVM_38525 [Streptomyces sp. CA-243310]|uniref:hypothetical protein n=1 Tax=Streptomyces sp. CA-243310 TaxID=3240056 RepID=UPI003D8B60E6